MNELSLGNDFYQFLHKACEQMLAVNKGAVYICMASSELHTLFEAFTKAGGKWSNFIIWAKNHFTMGRSDYQRQYEPILYGWSEGKGKEGTSDFRVLRKKKLKNRLEYGDAY